jgi:hypothetical protein
MTGSLVSWGRPGLMARMSLKAVELEKDKLLGPILTVSPYFSWSWLMTVTYLPRILAQAAGKFEMAYIFGPGNFESGCRNRFHAAMAIL